MINNPRCVHISGIP